MIQFETTPKFASSRSSFRWLGFFIVAGLTTVVAVFIASTVVLSAPPSNFPTDTDLVIREGSTIRDIAYSLEESGYIRSPLLFRLLVKGIYTDLVIRAGAYRFEEPLSLRVLIEKLGEGVAQTPGVPITFPEGFTVKDFGNYTNNVWSEIDESKLAAYEGFLFPDTYYVSPLETVDDLVLRMQAEYEEKIAPYRSQIAASPFTEREVITLASLLEREANDKESMRMVAGILKNRLEDDIPLQVDATFNYLLGKTSAELTLEDLEIDSPYNTYINTGLPPSPIANPGIMAIEAVLEATSSPYYYYLTGNDGKFYYARDFEEHKRNKARHLN